MHNPILGSESTPKEDPRPAVVDASAGVDVTFTEIGPVELNGISGVRLHARIARKRVDQRLAIESVSA
jgi:hypothetical protein